MKNPSPFPSPSRGEAREILRWAATQGRPYGMIGMQESGRGMMKKGDRHASRLKKGYRQLFTIEK